MLKKWILTTFWAKKGQKMGHFGPKFELYGSKVKNDPKNGFLDPKTIFIHVSHIGNNVLSVIPLDFVIFQKLTPTSSSLWHNNRKTPPPLRQL